MTPRNIVALVLVIVSLIVLVPGLSKPLITITATMELLGMKQEVFRQTRSIVQSVRSLHESGNDFVAALIFFFSITVPVIKAVLLGVVALLRSPVPRYRIFAFVRGISKWAMADVFVVGVYIAYLSARATDALDAELHSGFYYFTAYCLVSLLSLQFMDVPEPRRATITGNA